jgi:hypothetical protein
MSLLTLMENVKSMLNTSEMFKEFLKKRSEGAKKIADQAAKTGGFAKFTAMHFKAKSKPYKDAQKHFNDTLYYKHKFQESLEKLNDKWDKLSQQEFQKLMGEMEVWGEVWIKSKE